MGILPVSHHSWTQYTMAQYAYMIMSILSLVYILPKSKGGLPGRVGYRATEFSYCLYYPLFYHSLFLSYLQ